MPKPGRVLCLAAALVTVLAACDGCKQAVSDQRLLTPVRTSEVRLLDTGTANTYSANIQPYAQVDLAFKSSGYIVSIRQVRGADGHIRNVDIGDRAIKGTVLATVQEDEFKEKLSQAKAQLARAQSDYDRANLAFGRTSALFKADAVTKPDYDNANAQLQSTQASIDSAKASVTEATIALGYCQLRVPFDSWVLKRSVDVGSLVGPATNGFSLADTRSVKAVFGVPDTMIARIKLGSHQTVTTDAVPGRFQGRVTAISPAADPKSRVYSVEVTLPNANNRLKSGMIASIAIGGPASQKRMPVVPLSAVVRSPDDPKGFAVFVVESSEKSGSSESLADVVKVRTQDVSLGDAYGNVIAVLNGLGPGERVVTSGATMIRNGDQVRVIP
ncbi:MAG: efflux RND transporter periplasmic adaptor subunit [Acidobacteriaceae bacterium]